MKTTMIHVVPVPGALVPIPGPGRRYLPAQGRRVPATSYWLRRLAEGCCTEYAEVATASTVSAKSEKKKGD